METPSSVIIFVDMRFGWRFPALRTSATTLYRTIEVTFQNDR
jgi:hypothetical protein